MNVYHRFLAEAVAFCVFFAAIVSVLAIIRSVNP